MLHFQTLREGLPLFKALGSDTRIAILELLTEKGPMRMTAIAEELKITGGALTTHVKMLNEAGILSIEARGGRHGIQKICRVNDERIVVESPMSRRGMQAYEAELDIGQFVDVDAKAPCGIATPERLLLPADDPAVFSGPERLRAGVLWMAEGSVEYLVPNFLKAGQQLSEVQVSLEAAAGLPDASRDAEGSLLLSLNGKELGEIALSPENPEQYGMYNPTWWNQQYRQGGVYRLLTVDAAGTHVDGIRVSELRLADLQIGGHRSLPLKLTAKAGSGGFTLFGKGFGSLAQGIRVRMYYQERRKAEKKKAAK